MNKDICKKCISKHYKGEPWCERDEKRWSKYEVLCPGYGFVTSTERIPPGCLNKLAQLASQRIFGGS